MNKPELPPSLYVIVKPDALLARETAPITRCLQEAGFAISESGTLLLREAALLRWNPAIASLPNCDDVIRFYSSPMLVLGLRSVRTDAYAALIDLKHAFRATRNIVGYRNLLHTPNNESEAKREREIQRDDYVQHLEEYSTSWENRDGRMMKVKIIGDSFVEGVGDGAGGWVARLRRAAGFDVSSHGVGGDNSADVLDRVRGLEGEFDLVLVEVGINDSRYRPSLGRAEVPLAQFSSNVKEIARELRKRSPGVAFLGLTRVDQHRTDPYKDDKHYRNALIAEYDVELLRLAKEGYFDYVPVPGLADNLALLSDGLHPSSAGHEELLTSVLAFLDGRTAVADVDT